MAINSKRLSCTILIFLFILSVVSAVHVEGGFYRRQNAPLGTGASASKAATTTTPATTSHDTPTSTPTTDETTPTTKTSDETTSTPSTTTPTTSENSDTSQTTEATAAPSSSDDNNPVTVTSTSTSSSRDSQKTSSGAAKSSASSTPSQTPFKATVTSNGKTTTIASAIVTSATQRIVTTVVTVSGGSTYSHTVTTSSVVPVTRDAKATDSPSLESSGEGSSSSGLSDKSKRIIVGVVVGVGGAIILGGLGIVAWRIWGRRKGMHDEDDDLMRSEPGSTGQEKTGSANGSDPFRSTLDQYHTRPGPVNTAANF
ncbi:hypothetical protein L228DRAFT_236754 [Xylona heveae TC161]|uniref:Uncharacterized protein n=1 Tax=Xylona heveae (strain CBS 132557 / TC161) TaxID=1328760 RepID=A0A165J3K8_XYLHT|nr:hypothetical protein L228DRAFT_236754 [Xylona heveae TC161]KZF25683.1 hypothetical protein L228DRAFT_236754 [Xylona heveae TC161]